MREPRFYVYKCVVDDGGAPCIDNNILSLTICKPYIRSTAREGDLIFAFGSNNETPNNRLVYIAEVGRKFSGGKYFELDEFKNRGDCIYERNQSGKLVRRTDAKFHDFPTAWISDLGEDGRYPKANALVASNFRYFGKAGTSSWKSTHPRLKELIEKLGQGHRVNFTQDLRSELLELKKGVWRRFPENKVLGRPMHTPDEHIDPDDGDVMKICNTRCYYIAKKCRL
ncbi:hypothetical protein MIZ01_1928 [Sideroxyarcus emersonii]|uniref:Nucleotide modification associated domain-containing protein n=1 Tax=Sideroxyarcus emersonii TaxID=2764705 RepID=A0AAN1XBK1_9PROT|nr:hypothetical protein [Sideroxyarcus emersonii]BCK88127.1 hypothetical protein MIZ01_1928 [Sideroxyarcus emersonii]